MKANVLSLGFFFFFLVILNFVAFLKVGTIILTRQATLVYKYNFIQHYAVDAFPNVYGSLCCSYWGKRVTRLAVLM